MFSSTELSRVVTAAVVRLTPALALALPSAVFRAVLAFTAAEILSSDACVSKLFEVQRHTLW